MFHVNLKSRRLFCGLSQQQVADYLKVTAQSISKWEKGTALPSIEYLPKLADILDCSINDFFENDIADNENLTLLNDFFILMNDLSYYGTKKIDDTLSFVQKHPSIKEVLSTFCESLNQYQTISCKMLQNILSFTETETLEFIKRLEVMQIIEKLEGTNLYYVNPEAGSGLLMFLEMCISMVEDVELMKAREERKK